MKSYPYIGGETMRILVDNAIKYTVGSSTITVDAKEHQISFENNTDPITKEQVSQLFDRFYRVDSSRNRATGGSGLGLAIAKKIAETNQLRLSAELINDHQIRFVIDGEKNG